MSAGRMSAGIPTLIADAMRVGQDALSDYMQSGLHWQVRAELARRGGIRRAKPIDEKSIDGFIQSLRGSNRDKDPSGKYGHQLPENAGRYARNDLPAKNRVEDPPARPKEPESYIASGEDVTPEDEQDLPDPNHWVGGIPEDVHSFDFAAMGDIIGYLSSVEKNGGQLAAGRNILRVNRRRIKRKLGNGTDIPRLPAINR